MDPSSDVQEDSWDFFIIPRQLRSPLLPKKKKNKHMKTIKDRKMFPESIECNQNEMFTSEPLSSELELPAQKALHDAIRRITPDTLQKVLCGEIKTKKQVTIIDCRYRFEYDGGHISTALSISSVSQAENMLFEEDVQERVIVVHCEHSCERAPRMALALRSRDRGENASVYPRLFYKDLYVLEGGYNAFFRRHSELCTPCGYVSMHADGYKEYLRHERRRKKKRDREKKYIKPN
eukprot:GHVN01014066.1.p1 GENE.GHVN01014066.1~~GHVN01014066.1.p1  ORF type:complete len:235 (+),score=15.97 GHVN01014066.1:32-736(+)